MDLSRLNETSKWVFETPDTSDTPPILQIHLREFYWIHIKTRPGWCEKIGSSVTTITFQQTERTNRTVTDHDLSDVWSDTRISDHIPYVSHKQITDLLTVLQLLFQVSLCFFLWSAQRTFLFPEKSFKSHFEEDGPYTTSEVRLVMLFELELCNC